MAASASVDEDPTLAIAKYEDFIKFTLQPLLEENIKKREDLVEDIDEYTSLKEKLTSSKFGGEFKSNVDIGNGVFVQSVVANSTSIFVNIGLATFVECTLLDALHITESRLLLLNRRLELGDFQKETIVIDIEQAIVMVKDLRLLSSSSSSTTAV